MNTSLELSTWSNQNYFVLQHMVLLQYASCIPVALAQWLLPWSYGFEACLIYSVHLCVIIRCLQVVPDRYRRL